jgi:nucleotide-binding universal stress UspA family protein
MATHSRGRLGGALLGSVAEALLRRIACPFVLVGPHCAPAWPADATRMLACLDESAASGATLATAAEWSEALGLELWLGEVFHPLDVASAEAPYRFLDSAVERLGRERTGVRVCAAWNRSAPDEIVHLARTLSVSMIAMGTHGRSGLARMALGSVTAAVAHDAQCPVLTVRSPGLR